MKEIIKELYRPVSTTLLEKQLAEFKEWENSPSENDLKLIFSSIDLTTLSVTDTERKIAGLCEKVNEIPRQYSGAGNVAGICVYPVFIPVIKSMLTAVGVRIVSVSGGFPAAQTFREVKVKETQMALESGADEIDIVIPVRKILEGKLIAAYEEVKTIREIIGSHGTLKVILESGILNKPEKVQQASLVAMAAGADFIKTSTGKVQPAARPEDVIVMAETAKHFYQATGKKKGIKPAGGISTPEDANLYMHIIREILGREWITQEYFRIGASRLANHVLQALTAEKTGRQEELPYF